LEIVRHENGQLQAALFTEKNKRQRGKRLNVAGEVATGDAQLFSPTAIGKAQVFQDGKEAAMQEEIHQKALRKEEKERARVQMLKEKEEAQQQKEADRQLVREEKEAAAAAKRAEIEERKAERALRARNKEIEVWNRKLEQMRRKEAAATAAAERRAERAASKRSKNAAPNAANTLENAVKRFNGSTATGSPEKQPSIAPPATATDLAVDPPAALSSTGRTLQRPARFQY
jgi:hypothetical protein